MSTGTLRRRALPLALTLTGALVSAGLMAMPASPASAVPVSLAKSVGVGEGKALVRIDAAKVSVKKVADGAYLLTVPIGSAGQWMGERTASNGKSRLRVGNVSASGLAENWGSFRLGKTGVKATLVWNSNKGASASKALVWLKKPTVSDSGVSFRLTTRATLPAHPQQVTLNVSRAKSKQVRTDYQVQGTISITEALKYWAAFEYPAYWHVRLYNSSNDNTCWSYDYPAEFSTALVDIPDGRCDDVAYTDANNNIATAPQPSLYIDDYLTGTWTPDGEASFSWTEVVVTQPPGTF